MAAGMVLVPRGAGAGSAVGMNYGVLVNLLRSGNQGYTATAGYGEPAVGCLLPVEATARRLARPTEQSACT